MNRCPLDALCNCLAFSPLHERLRCASLARRWHEAVIEPSLWAQLVPEPEDLACLSSLLKRFGGSVRFLKIASHGPFRLSTSLNLEQLSKCSQLEELYLGGFRGRDLESFCQTSCQIDSLRALTIECDPYFNLGSFSHNTGAHMASLPAAWLSSFPNLERLVCDYLKLETNELPEACDSDSTSEPEEILWEVGEERAGEYLPGQGLQGGQGSPGAVRQADSEVPESADRAERSEGLEVTGNALLDAEHRTGSERLELPAAAVRREKARGSSLGEAGCDGRALVKLRDLSFVAIVRGHGSTWNSPHCRCDLSVLASLAPGLERLQIRSPNIALGRMSRRPGQRIEGLIKVSRHFCSTGLRDLLAAGYLLPALKELKVEVVKDDTGQPWDSSGSVLSISSTSKPLRQSHLSVALGVHDRPFRISVGASDGLATKLRCAANVPASAASISTFQSFAVAEQHLPLLQHLQRYQEKAKLQDMPSDLEIDIIEVA